MRSASLSSGACTEALAVKKSAEIAALFADIKLSQTTDITHVIPQEFEADIRSMYKNSHVKPKSFPKSDDKKTLAPANRALKSSLYPSKILNKGNMYSARNGLYTIQSQSDESRRSSVCESGLNKDGRELFNSNDKPVSSHSIENSLGYLP